VAFSYAASVATGLLEERLWSASSGKHLLIDNLEACALPMAAWASDGAVGDCVLAGPRIGTVKAAWCRNTVQLHLRCNTAVLNGMR
jgi:hypothetical protein